MGETQRTSKRFRDFTIFGAFWRIPRDMEQMGQIDVDLSRRKMSRPLLTKKKFETLKTDNQFRTKQCIKYPEFL